MSQPPRKSRRPTYLSGPGTPRPVPADEAKETQGGADKETPPPPQEDRVLYSWTVWLLPRRPLVSALVVGVLLFSIYLAYWALPQLLFVGLITFILLNRLAPYLFPVKYTISEQKAGYKTFLASDSRPWGKFFTYYKFKDGVLLSNDTRTVRGRFKEGLFMYYSSDTPVDEVLAVIGSKLPEPEEAMKPKDDGQYKGGVGSALRRIRKLRDK
ncbi:MAG: hypothetical protein ACOX5M_10750 [Bacillota bacterium]